MKKNKIYNSINNNSGFIVADFLFSFVLVIGVAIFIFGITFSLATIEIGQYIVWSTARNYSAANKNKDVARINAEKKFMNLAAQFPLLTGVGASGSSPWFELNPSNVVIGDLAISDLELNITTDDKKNGDRQPWIGVRAKINLKLFSGFNIPFLGKVGEDESIFEFPIRAFILRHPSNQECVNFFNQNRYNLGIKAMEPGLAPNSSSTLNTPNTLFAVGEDNGC